MESKVLEFQGEYRFLSNFHPAPIWIDGLLYPTVEHFYQSRKFKGKDREEIRLISTPGRAKRRARELSIRPDWNEIKEGVMFIGVLNKFSQHLELGEKLIETLPAILEEGNNWHDNFWGICHCGKCKKSVAQNKLGNLLMFIRDEVLKNGLAGS